MNIRLPISVRSTHIDEFGHVNNAKFVEYLEWGRFEWYDRTGIAEAFRHDQTRTLGAVVAHMDVNYLAEAKRGDALVVQTTLCKLGTKSMRFAQQIDKAGDTPVAVCRATVTGVLFDLSNRRSLEIPAEMRSALASLLG